MNKTELIDYVAAQTGHSREVVGRVIDSTTKAVHRQLQRGMEVRLSGFGTFSVKYRDAYDGRNPSTGETIRVPAKKTVKFRPHADLASGIG